jgi:hypothetical protein
MDYNPNHFPTLIAIYVIIGISLYILVNMITFFHERSLKKKQHLTTNDELLITDKINEEPQEMANISTSRQ